ncbi:MAG TPA: polysaccharide deacetylase family protein [Steroidobacteraceae bacterium]|nr:polysaccharide deacetylase family protein [Steroidobacteraceae bacterium]
METLSALFRSRRKGLATASLIGALALHSTTSTAACNGYVGITFDDGPTSNTSTLINLLKQNSLTPVTWFNWGQRVSSNPSLIPQELSVGEVQNHSYTHPHMSGYSYQQVVNELSQANQAIQSAGAPKPTLYRAPYGELNSTIRQAAQSLGLFAMTWDVDSGDWNGASTSAIVNAASNLQNGQVILMHDGYANTNNAIAQIANNLRARSMCPGRIDPATGRAVAPSGGGGGGGGGGGTGTITVRARGVSGGEQIQLVVNNATIATWTLTNSYQNYTANSSATSNILVKFINDASGRDVQVDYIIAGGVTKQAENQTYNTGVYQNGACGGGNGLSEWLHCNGAIGF